MLIGKMLQTEFAPPERLCREAVLKQYQQILSDDNLKLIYDYSSDLIIVTNEYRQTIFANRTLLNFLQKEDLKEIVGLRPGEILGCGGVNESTGGCGTSRVCKVCGALKAVLEASYGNTTIGECCIQTKDGKTSYNFRVWAAKPWENRDYTLLIIRDIADEKFRNAMEQAFFHDLTNTASDMKGLLDLIDSPDTYRKYAPMLSGVSRELLNEINGQRDLRYAEEGTIMIHKSPVNALELLNEFIDLYRNQEITRGINLVVSEDSEPVSFSSDERLLARVIENMLKNAIEASAKGQTVTAACRKHRGYVVFSIHNPNVMTEKVQLNIFKRAFSTKSQGRGWGTYSMKLLTENYLDGKIEFRSTEESGTTFFAKYPLS
ncbi:MAG: HAMP domain-containing sensor histidine kinase [Victivallaceae bacterium]|nr:HAMP domain-containing sensor histidine kinase [Victivallaceae bacterium]